MMYLHQDSGLINISYFKFDVEHSGVSDEQRYVPFRLTPNIVEYLSSTGINGPLTASAIATARCLVQPNFKVNIENLCYAPSFANLFVFFPQLPAILRAILKDEIIALQKKRLLDERLAAEQAAALGQNTPLQERPVGSVEVDTDQVILVVEKVVASIMARLNGLCHFEKPEPNKMSQLVQAATNPDNLCCMDPTWHPWL